MYVNKSLLITEGGIVADLISQRFRSSRQTLVVLMDQLSIPLVGGRWRYWGEVLVSGEARAAFKSFPRRASSI